MTFNSFLYSAFYCLMIRVFVCFNVCLPFHFSCCNCGLTIINKRLCLNFVMFFSNVNRARGAHLTLLTRGQHAKRPAYITRTDIGTTCDPHESEGILPAMVCLCVCLSVTTITKKIVDGFVQNFMGRFLGGKERPSSCFVTIGRGMWK